MYDKGQKLISFEFEKKLQLHFSDEFIMQQQWLSLLKDIIIIILNRRIDLKRRDRLNAVDENLSPSYCPFDARILGSFWIPLRILIRLLNREVVALIRFFICIFFLIAVFSVVITSNYLPEKLQQPGIDHSNLWWFVPFR